MTPEENNTPIQTSFIDTIDEGNGIRYATGKTLRREYKYKQRASFIFDEGPGFIWTDRESKAYYPIWEAEAEKLYPDEGDYMVNTTTGVATFQGQL